MNIDSSTIVLVRGDARGHPGITAPATLVQPNMESVISQQLRSVKVVCHIEINNAPTMHQLCSSTRSVSPYGH